MADGPIINIDDLEYMDFGDGGGFEARIGAISAKIGALKLGYNLTRLQPGKRAFPYHLHHNNEEMFLVLEGEGTLRYDGTEHAIRRGDVIACPPGPGTARQIVNTSEVELVYLALSTMDQPEVAEYPDSDKIAVLCGGLPGTGQPPALRTVHRKDQQVGYFDGEE